MNRNKDGVEIFLSTANPPIIYKNLNQLGKNYGIGGLHLINLANESIGNHLFSYR